MQHPAPESTRKTTITQVHITSQERAEILGQWCAGVPEYIPGIDRSLLARRGAVYKCGACGLDLLDARAGSESRPHRASRQQAEAPHGAQGAETSAWLQCLSQWEDLPVSWNDVRLLITALEDVVSRRFAARAGETPPGDWLTPLVCALSERRIAILEARLELKREETSLNDVVAGRFLAHASHELRTPLTAILGFSDLLMEEHYGPVTAEQSTVLGHIENSAQTLQEVIDNLLDIMRIRSGEFTLRYRSVDLRGLLVTVHRMLQPLSGRKRVTCEADLPVDLGVIEADESIVKHLVYHLLTSSIRATPSGGTVALSAFRDDASVILVMRDSALHLPPEAVQNMLDPFPRLENVGLRGYEGWEVGLPLIRRYVDLHGGSIDVTSLPEHGTEFRISLPAKKPHLK